MDNTTLLQSLTPEQLGDIIENKITVAFDRLFQKMDSTSPSNDLLTREEACKLLSINSSTLWSYTNQGRIQAYSIGSRRYYKRSELLASLTPVSQ